MSLRALFRVAVVGSLAVACGSESGVGGDDGGTSGASVGGASGASGTGGVASGAAGMAGGGGSMSGTAGTGGATGVGGSAGTSAGAGGSANAGTSGSGGASGASPSGNGGLSSGGASGGPAGAGGMQAGAAGTGDGCSTSGAAGTAGAAGMAGAAGNTGSAGTTGGAGTGGDECPASGNVTYTLATEQNPTADQEEAYELITAAMDEALEYYNCYTNITKTLTVQYNPSVATADGNSNGNIRFGGKQYMEYSRAMHEIAHTVGIGTYQEFHDLVVDGIFTGEAATAQVRTNTGNPSEQVHADSQHFWPGGLNYASEAGSEKDVIDHCLMVVAIRKDMGFDP
jgi:hypothetical protein